MSNPSELKNKIVAEIISIGDEITTGAILDTNAQYLSQSLSEVGVRVLYHSTVGDDKNAMSLAFATAVRRADVVVVTGGLGPTQDDLTRQVAADVFGVDLVYDPSSFEHVASFFKNRGRQMPESNKIQAYFPRGSHIIYNPHGTAPGFIVEQDRKELHNYPEFISAYPIREGSFIFLSFPGVPAELKEMWTDQDGREAVVRFVNQVSGGVPRVYLNKLIHTFGAGESSIEEKLPNLIARDHFPLVGITAKDSVITLRIFAEGSSEEECQQQVSDVSKTIYSKVGEFVFAEDAETFSEVISHNLRAQCRKVGLFEWGTQGILASKLEPDVLAFARVFGDSECGDFIQLFGDSSATPTEKRIIPQKKETFGSVFYTIETELPEELLRLCEAESRGQKVDYFIAIGPYPTSIEQANSTSNTVDVVFIDFRDKDKPVQRRETFFFGGHPAIRNILFCNHAMDMLRKHQ